MGGQRQAPATLPPRKTRYPLYGRLVGPQDRSGRLRNISPPTGIRSPDRPALASRYTDWVITAHGLLWGRNKLFKCYFEGFGAQVTIHAISRQSVAAEAQVRQQVKLREVCDWQRANGTDFSPSIPIFPCQSDFTNPQSGPAYYHPDKFAKPGNL